MSPLCVVGSTLDCGTRRVGKEEIIAFAREFDPQPFHIDEAAAAKSHFGGVIASGWHSGSICMRLVVDAVLHDGRLPDGPWDLIRMSQVLEHVPDPAQTIAACATLVKPGGDVFLSTLNRNPKAYLFAVIGAEYILNMLPKGTHDYAKFIKPAELIRMARDAGLDLVSMTGMSYNPLSKVYSLGDDTSVNYLVHLRRSI